MNKKFLDELYYGKFKAQDMLDQLNSIEAFPSELSAEVNILDKANQLSKIKLYDELITLYLKTHAIK